jgi:hypothetical protein
MPIEYLEKRAEIRKGFDGLEITIPSKICWISVFYFALMLAVILNFMSFAKDSFIPDFNILNLLFLYVIGTTLYQAVFQSFSTEKILITRSNIQIKRSLLGFGSNKKYDYSLIKDFKITNNKIASSSFSIVGKFNFKYKKKHIQFARAIKIEEAEEILKKIKDSNYIPKKCLYISEDEWRIGDDERF